MSVLSVACLSVALADPSIRGSQLGAAEPPDDVAISIATAPTSNFLADWMGSALPAIGSKTLLDLSLPGTHESMSYDWNLGSIAQQLARSQALVVKDQLENGIRFLDVRIMFVDGDWYCVHRQPPGTFVKSNRPAIDYLTEVRDWMKDHPKEMVVITLSRRGNMALSGGEQYPGVSIADKKAFWTKIEAAFQGMLVNHEEKTASNLPVISDTPIGKLIAKNQRVVIYAADHKEFTGSSQYALPGKKVDLDGRVDVDNSPPQQSYYSEMALFKASADRLIDDKAQNMFYLLSLTQEYAFNADFLGKIAGYRSAHVGYPLDQATENDRTECARKFFGTTGFDAGMRYCPESLRSSAQVRNYYTQVSVEEAFKKGLKFPNAVSVDALDETQGTPTGLLRTGTLPVGDSTPSSCQWTGRDSVVKWTECYAYPECYGLDTEGGRWTWTDGADGDWAAYWETWDTDTTHQDSCYKAALGWHKNRCCRSSKELDTAGYAFVDTVILYNLGDPNDCTSQECKDLIDLVTKRRAANPLRLWDDTVTGRTKDIDRV